MIGLTERELQIIHDQTFLLTKAKALAKIYTLLSSTRDKLKTCIWQSPFTNEQKSVFKTDKISKGDNYLGLPYHVLDYPAFFSKKDTFAFRTMFWWGNAFSATLHLEGQFLSHFKTDIIQNLNELIKSEIYICVADNPWQYHYGTDNYVPLTMEHSSFIEDCQFLKLSKKMALDQWKELPGFASNFLCQLLKILT